MTIFETTCSDTFQDLGWDRQEAMNSEGVW